MNGSDQTTSQEAPARSFSRPFRLFGYFTAGSFLFLSTYVLSLGPVARLVNAGIIPDDVAILYTPLELAYLNSPIVRKFLDVYLQFWKI